MCDDYHQPCVKLSQYYWQHPSENVIYCACFICYNDTEVWMYLQAGLYALVTFKLLRNIRIFPLTLMTSLNIEPLPRQIFHLSTLELAWFYCRGVRLNLKQAKHPQTSSLLPFLIHVLISPT